jgi:hypothetical protein
MKKSIVIVLLVILLTSCHSTYQATNMSVNNVRTHIQNWPAKPKEAANMMIDKYGAPNEVTDHMLVWNNNGVWKRTIVFREEVAHDFPMPHTDLLEQFIDFRVPVGKFDELARYDGSVVVERTKGEISARCDKEEMNFLALNLAYDVIMGNKTVQEARMYYAKAAMDFMKGIRDSYTQGLKFTLPGGNTGDPDKPAKM